MRSVPLDYRYGTDGSVAAKLRNCLDGSVATAFWGSLQKVQGYRAVQGRRTAQGHMAGVDVDVTPPTGGPVGHPPNLATLCDRSVQGSKS